MKPLVEEHGEEGWCGGCGRETEAVLRNDGFEYEYGSIRGWKDESYVSSACCDGENVYVYAYDLDYDLWHNAVINTFQEFKNRKEGTWTDILRWLHKEKYEPEDIFCILQDHLNAGGFKPVPKENLNAQST